MHDGLSRPCGSYFTGELMGHESHDYEAMAAKPRPLADEVKSG